MFIYSLLLHLFVDIFSFLLKLYFGLFSQCIFTKVNIGNVEKLFKLVNSILGKFHGDKTKKSFSQILHLQVCCCIQNFMNLLHTSFSVNFLHQIGIALLHNIFQTDIRSDREVNLTNIFIFFAHYKLFNILKSCFFYIL